MATKPKAAKSTTKPKPIDAATWAKKYPAKAKALAYKMKADIVKAADKAAKKAAKATYETEAVPGVPGRAGKQIRTLGGLAQAANNRLAVVSLALPKAQPAADVLHQSGAKIHAYIRTGLYLFQPTKPARRR
jgi:hypothetical protein